MAGTPGSKLFLSYRRDDAEGQAGRLYNRLNTVFPGRVFRDVSGIEIGVDFARAIQEAIASSTAFVAVIGKQWLSLANEQGQHRIMQPNDYVRLEIATALQRSLRVYPVLVDGAKMPSEEDLPPDLQPLARINAIELTVTDYDHLVERLISVLKADLGKPGGDEPNSLRSQVDGLAARAEASIALEDWMAAIQSLQSALSLDPANAPVASRLRLAREQLQVSGLYADGQRRYQSLDKKGALERFRQVRAIGGSYKNVDSLISQLELELRAPDGPPPRKPGWIKWAVAAVVVFGIIVYFADKSTPQFTQAPYVAPVRPDVPAQNDSPPAQRTGDRENGRQTLRPETDIVPELAFAPSGQWDMSSEVNPALGMMITFSPGGQFSVQTRAGAYQFPASAGAYQYNPAGRLLVMTGYNTSGLPFQEAVQIEDRHGDHIQALYNGTQWALRKR